MAVALLVAAGRGERLGADRPKALVMLAGRPLLEWSLDALRAARRIERIVVALPPGVPAPPGVVGVEGGAVRSASVQAALAAGSGDPVVVHDAARPLVDAAIVDRAVEELEREGADAAIVAAPVTDTVKRATADGVVEATLDRSRLWAVQTPQVFRRAALQAAVAVSDDVLSSATDDAWLIERAGGQVRIVSGPRENLKVTTRLDLEVAEILLRRRAVTSREPADRLSPGVAGGGGAAC